MVRYFNLHIKDNLRICLTEWRKHCLLVLSNGIETLEECFCCKNVEKIFVLKAINESPDYLIHIKECHWNQVAIRY